MVPLVAHVDMDAFFASVEIRSDPRLAGKPLIVGGGPSGRGVVTTASYAAREYGIRSGMSQAEALRRCPHLLALPVDGSKMVHESLRVLAVLDRISSRVEAASIDEAYVEFPRVALEAWESIAFRRGLRIRSDMRRCRGLPCSVGLGANKLQAKMATPLGKPEGVSLVPPGAFLRVFGDRPVSLIPGVGPRTTAELASLDIRTIHDLARARLPGDRFGKWAEVLAGQARGEDPRPVFAAGEEPPPRSAGHETTFSRDVSDPRLLEATLWLLADRVSRRLRRHHFLARTVVVRFKVGTKRYSRQRVLELPTDETAHLARVSRGLLEASRRGRALRLVGVAGAGLTPAHRPEYLFPGDRNRRTLIRTGDRIRDRFGEGAMVPATALLGEEARS